MDSIASISGATQARKLTPDQQAMLEKLQARDREVRAHEQAHMAAAGSLARGGPQYTLQQGPDGKLYAIGGKVDIDLSPGKTAAETLQKARQIRSAALAPMNPSGQDTAVYVEASRMEADAMQKVTRRAATMSYGATNLKSQAHYGNINLTA